MSMAFGGKQFGACWASPVAVVLGLLAIPEALKAQSCPLCYQSAASGGPQLIQALRNGVLVLFFPPLLILGAICYAAYRKRDQFNSIEGALRIEFEFDEPDGRRADLLDGGGQRPGRTNVADTIEL
jgi:hypothetical protein